MPLNLTDYMWTIAQHTPMRAKLILYCAPGQSEPMARALKEVGLKAGKLSRGLVVMYRAEQIWAALNAVGATLTDGQSMALVRYVQAHRAGRQWRRGSSEEYKERVGAMEEVCREFGLVYKGVRSPDEH
jgi:hypothetical protein